MSQKKAVLHRHYQSLDWWIDIIVAGVRSGTTVFNLAETRRGPAPMRELRTEIRGECLSWGEAHRRYTDRAHAMSREAGLEDQRPVAFTDGGRLK